MKIDNSTLRRRVLGEHLRLLRKQASFTQDEVAPIVNCSTSKLSRVENGQRAMSIEDVAVMLGLYRAGPAMRGYLLALAREADEEDWLLPKGSTATYYHDTLGILESKAEQIVRVDPGALPRLLQTHRSHAGAIAAALVTSGWDHACDAVSADRDPPTLLAFVEECALHRPLVGLESLSRQVEQLRQAEAGNHWSIRVVPADQVAASGPFTLLRLPDRLPVVVLEHLTCRLLLERPEDVDAYERTLKHLDKNALGETASLELISNAADALDTSPTGTTHSHAGSPALWGHCPRTFHSPPTARS